MQGWVCPKCGAVMSPSMAVCVNCHGQSTVSASGTCAHNWTGWNTSGGAYCSKCGAMYRADRPPVSVWR
jgi:uncharacterized OB-fold protein